MNLAQIVEALGWEVKTPTANLEGTVTGGYACDLLSYVMAGAKPGNLWMTVQGHPNVVAVASLINLAGIVVVEDAKIDPVTVTKAEQEGIPLLATHETAYIAAGRLYALGVRTDEQTDKRTDEQ